MDYYLNLPYITIPDERESSYRITPAENIPLLSPIYKY